jgi:hypothetical protein
MREEIGSISSYARGFRKKEGKINEQLIG